MMYILGIIVIFWILLAVAMFIVAYGHSVGSKKWNEYCDKLLKKHDKNKE